MLLKRLALGIALAASFAVAADAQFNGPFNGPLNPSSQASLSVSTVDANVALPNASQDVVINTGPQAAYINPGAAATTANMPVGPGCAIPIAPYGASTLHAITAQGATTLTIVGGYGTDTLPPTGCSPQGTNTIYAANAVTKVINISTATTTKLVAGTAGLKTYVTFIGWQAGAADNVTLEYGTTTTNPCDTGTTTLSGQMNSAANNSLVQGVGGFPIIIVPAGNDFCMVTSAAQQLGGYLDEAQF